MKETKIDASSPNRLEIKYLLIDELIPYSRNPRTHSEEQIAQIAASIREFGFTNPILLDSKKGIIAGHGRLAAAKKLDLKIVPCIDLSHLTEEQKRAYIIADNKLAQ
jgi:ParB-like chromosome segregation protein Spo0J